MATRVPEESIEDQYQEEIQLEAEVAKLRAELGLEDPKTLEKVFELFSNWIALYRLNKTDALLQEVVPVCKKLGGTWHIKAIQSLGFCRWKQYRFTDALECFLEMEKLVGPSTSLFENIGHTYSSLGNLEKAEEYFQSALKVQEEIDAVRAKLPEAMRGAMEDKENRGGILLGLGLVKERRGDIAGALVQLERALKCYQEKFKDTDASLTAKAHMSVGKAHEKLNHLPEAEQNFREALRIFIKTCGRDSPLTAGALGSLGKVLYDQHKLEEAQVHLKEALSLEATKDSVHLMTVFELMLKIIDLHTGGDTPLNRQVFKQYVPIVQNANKFMRAQGVPLDGDFGVFAKTAGEICLLAEEYETAIEFLSTATDLLAKVTTINVSKLRDTAETLLRYGITELCKRMKAAPVAGQSTAAGAPSDAHTASTAPVEAAATGDAEAGSAPQSSDKPGGESESQKGSR
eukprot:RCo006670